ncbi:phage tail protein [Snodgrassella communis]|uniref:phage tail protein n=1 Tax=Snodgrassella communis TaxID=2946699 RepID=UPI001EF5E48E|nr:phage tail protein [Snodgrassella communis]
MANLKETSFWEEGIYQWETSDPVLGGENGIDNVPTRQLANRTKWLKDNKLDKSATAANAELAKRANTADRLSAARKVGGVAFDGSTDIDLPGVNKPGNQNTSGNAGSAFKLYNPRKINGVPFDGTQDINATPAGAVMYFAMDAAPVGWLKANGAVVSRTLYANLFAAIGTRFGAGDGKTTFNLPDLRGEFLRGWDDGRSVDFGRDFGGWQIGTPICHDDTSGIEHFNPVGMCRDANNFGDPWIGRLPEAYWSTFYEKRIPAGNPDFFTMTRPRNIALLACIKI